MPSDDSLLEQAEAWKIQGNSFFQKSTFDSAINSYSQGIVQVDRIIATPVTLKMALLSNRAACYLKIDRYDLCEDDCTIALDTLQNLKGGTTDADVKVRSKLLFRRAKARFTLANGKIDTASDRLNGSAKDLLQLLSVDSKNKEALKLLKLVRTMNAQLAKSSTPVARTMDKIRQNKENETACIHQLKVLLGLLDNDNVTNSTELGRISGVTFLLELAMAESENPSIRSLALQCLSCAGSHPHFVRSCCGNVQNQLLQILQKDDMKHNVAVAALAFYLRLILHLDRDDPDKPISYHTRVDTEIIVEVCKTAFLKYNDTSVIRATLEILSIWTSGKERDTIIRASLADTGITGFDGVHVPATKMDQHQMTPRELATYRAREADRNKRDETWAYERARQFCKEDGLKELMKKMITIESHSVRRELTVTLGRVLAAIESDEKIKKVVKPFLTGGTSLDEAGGVTIEEIFNEDDENEEKQEEEEVQSLESMMERAGITNALLLSKQEVGVWCLVRAWEDAEEELEALVNSNNGPAMCMASEVISAASAVKECRMMMHNFMNDDMVKKLTGNADRDIRSGAASAVAKLGLGVNIGKEIAEEGEVVGLLQTSADLLEQEDDEDDHKGEDKIKLGKLADPNSFANSSIVRGIEMMTYLISQTQAKEEIISGFSASVESKETCLERLVEICSMPNAGASLSGYGLATIFQHMAVTTSTLRKEMFTGKEFSMEQYDEIQKMGKTPEEKEAMSEEKPDDNDDACSARIHKMANANVARALVNLAEGASDRTLGQLMVCIRRMAGEESVRGMMIQQGVLSTLIKIEKEEDTNKVLQTVIRDARHCIAKLLVTINPSLLTSAQRMGSIKPLILLIRDIDAFDLPRFEALLSITNLASVGDDTKNRIIAEKGISSLHYAMFSTDQNIRKASTEAMSNLVPHKDMMDYMKKHDNLRLWLAFAADFEENHGCARAASGCLAMVAQYPEIALELTKLKNFEVEMTTLVQSGEMDLMHRTFALILELVSHGGKCLEACKKASLIDFCRIYVDNYHDGSKVEDFEFTEENMKLMPITVDLAKKIVLASD